MTSGRHARTTEIRADHVGPTEIRADHVGPTEIRADHVGPTEIRADHVGPTEIRADHVGPTEIRADVDRVARTGAPEVVFAGGKSPAQTVAAATALRDAGVRPVLVTRADAARATAVAAAFPDAVVHDDCEVVVLEGLEPHQRPGRGIAIVTAGTSDLRVARECEVVLTALGESPRVVADVGVAGLHRVLAVAPLLEAARVVIVVAGMEAALAPVVAGLVRAPVVAVPTSVGYGAAQGGMTALHGLLTACTPGIGVVNIDNGLGAALLAHRILGPIDGPVDGEIDGEADGPVDGEVDG